jgi:hypothetical protein
MRRIRNSKYSITPIFPRSLKRTTDHLWGSNFRQPRRITFADEVDLRTNFRNARVPPAHVPVFLSGGANQKANTMSKTAEALAEKQESLPITQQHSNPWLEAAAEGGNETGKLLKFIKGECPGPAIHRYFARARNILRRRCIAYQPPFADRD